MESGVYTIKNKINNKIYIGSASDISKRWAHHYWALRHRIHANPYLQNAWDKNKEENFEFTILENTLTTQLIEREQYYLDLYKSYLPENGYNIRPKVDRNTGIHLSEEAKRKIGLGNKGKFVSDETRRKQSKAMTGFKHTEEARKKMSETHKKIGAPKKIIENLNRYARENGPWNKGLSKENSESIQRLAKSRVGMGNPMFGVSPVNKIKAHTINICKNCLKEFSGPRWKILNRKFCSKKCYFKYKEEIKNGPRITDTTKCN